MLITFYPPPVPGFGRDRPGSAAGFLRRQWILGAWRRGNWGDRVMFVVAILLWWPTTILHAAYLSLRLGPSRARRYGKSPLRQFAEQIAVAGQWMIPPLWYYTFELMDDAKRAGAADYVQRVQTKPFLYRWLIDRVDRRDKQFPFSNKNYFSQICQENGLPVSSIIAVVSSKRISFYDPKATGLPPCDLFIKVKVGRGGRGAEKWSYADDRYSNSDGRSFARAEFEDYLKTRARLKKRLVQRCLTNHSALADVNLGALATVRVLTLRNEAGAIEATHAVIRMPQRKGAPVDNIHAGGIAAPIDLATGVLGRATDLGVRPDSTWHERHPVTGAPILGRTLPHWAAVLELVCRAHALIGDRVVVGWDVAILEGGPCLVEGNGKPDVDLIQRPHGRGLADSRFGEIVAFHLKGFLAGDTRNGRVDAPAAKPKPAAANSAD